MKPSSAKHSLTLWSKTSTVPAMCAHEGFLYRSFNIQLHNQKPEEDTKRP